MNIGEIENITLFNVIHHRLARLNSRVNLCVNLCRNVRLKCLLLLSIHPHNFQVSFGSTSEYILKEAL